MEILTDCDGVLLNWLTAFDEWMHRNGKIKIANGYNVGLNYGLTKSKLEHFRNQVKETERELVEQKKHIDRIRNEFSKKKIEEESFDSDVNEIKNEISSVVE